MLKLLDSLVASANRRKYSAGSTILFQGEVPKHVCVLLKGITKVYNLNNNGDEQIATFYVEGEFFPTAWIFGLSSCTLFYYEASTDCEVAFINRTIFNDLISRNPELSNKIMKYYMTNYSAALMQINSIQQSKAKDKLISLLYFLCQRYGKQIGEYVEIPISLTHLNIANMIGITRETTAIEVYKLRVKKIIKYSKKHYQVNLKNLIEMMGDDLFGSINVAIEKD